MNEYDYEDAFKDANRYAGNVVNLSDALKTVETRDQAKAIIGDLQNQYQLVFSAFIAGVARERQIAALEKKRNALEVKE